MFQTISFPSNAGQAVFLYREGRLQQALVELAGQLRSKPDNSSLRVFLFELLCFAGEFSRATQQLEVLAAQDASLVPGAMTYQALLRAHQKREEQMVSNIGTTLDDDQPVHVNNVRYGICTDEDERIGAGLEMYVGGDYRTVPWSRIRQVEIKQPATLRDLLWIPAKVIFKGLGAGGEAEPVHLPALAPSSWKHDDDAVRLGRTSVMEETTNGNVVAYGAKMLVCDSELISLLDVRSIQTEG